MSHVTSLVLVVTPTQFSWGRRGWEEDERETALFAAAEQVLQGSGRAESPALLPYEAPHVEFTCNWNRGWLEAHSTLPASEEVAAIVAAVKQAWQELMRR